MTSWLSVGDAARLGRVFRRREDGSCEATLAALQVESQLRRVFDIFARWFLETDS